ncbi:MAG TPA: Holliday junction branch migration protein RuvA [Beutenbergiaceae bacterium]|nr:Holliday junction branch migration protein RuvA [Beutenbergiaceae bacterium]
MIALLRGKVAHLGLDSLILEVGGIGYRVFTTPAALAELRHGMDVELATSLVVREDSLTLFGFPSAEERDTYETLQTVSGVGPKLALAMLAVHSPEDLRRAVEAEDLKTLQRVPGVGPKSAKRLALELGGKLGAPTPEPESTAPTPSAARGDVLDALVGLGWNLKVAEGALDAVLAAPQAPTDSAPLLRAVLVELGGKNRG